MVLAPFATLYLLSSYTVQRTTAAHTLSTLCMLNLSCPVPLAGGNDNWYGHTGAMVSQAIMNAIFPTCGDKGLAVKAAPRPTAAQKALARKQVPQESREQTSFPAPVLLPSVTLAAPAGACSPPELPFAGASINASLVEHVPGSWLLAAAAVRTIIAPLSPSTYGLCRNGLTETHRSPTHTLHAL